MKACLLGASLCEDDKLLNALIDNHEADLQQVYISSVQWPLFCAIRVQLDLEQKFRLTLQVSHQDAYLVILKWDNHGLFAVTSQEPRRLGIFYRFKCYVAAQHAAVGNSQQAQSLSCWAVLKWDRVAVLLWILCEVFLESLLHELIDGVNCGLGKVEDLRKAIQEVENYIDALLLAQSQSHAFKDRSQLFNLDIVWHL